MKNINHHRELIVVDYAGKLTMVLIKTILYIEKSGGLTEIFLEDGRILTSTKSLEECCIMIGKPFICKVCYGSVVNFLQVREFDSETRRINFQNGKFVTVPHRHVTAFYDLMAKMFTIL